MPVTGLALPMECVDVFLVSPPSEVGAPEDGGVN